MFCGCGSRDGDRLAGRFPPHRSGVCSSAGLIVLRDTGGGNFDVLRQYREQGPPGAYPRDATEALARGLDLGYAQGLAEDYVRQAGASALNNPRAAWRRKEPSEAALKFARRLGARVPDGVSAGELSELIDRAKAGRVK